MNNPVRHIAPPGAQLHGSSDPLLAAVISKLPAVGETFGAEARSKWLRMMAMAFDVTYGETAAVEIPEFLAAGEKPAGAAASASPVVAVGESPPPRPEHAKAGYDFYVDKLGYARCDTKKIANADGAPVVKSTPGRRITSDEVDAEIYDYRAMRDRHSVIWGDDEVGCDGLSLTFGGPGNVPD